MKKLIPLLIFSIAIIACNNKSKDSKSNSSVDTIISKDKTDNKSTVVPETGRYGIKSARVVTVTAMPNGMGNSVATMYFDNYGKISYTETVSNFTMKGVPAQPKKYSIHDGDHIYSWTEGKKTGTLIIMRIPADLSNIDFEKLGKEMMEEMNIKKAGTETWLGKTCEVIEINSDKMGKGKILTWKNITMLSDMNTMGMNTRS